MDCSTPGFPVLHNLQEFAQTLVHWVGNAKEIKKKNKKLITGQQTNFLLYFQAGVGSRKKGRETEISKNEDE